MNLHILYHKVVMVPHLSYIWEWNIHYDSLSAMFTPLHSSTNRQLFKKYFCKQSSHYEKHGCMACHAPQLLSETEASITLHCRLCSIWYIEVQIKNYFEKHFCTQGSHYEKYGQFPSHKVSQHMQPPNQHFHCQQRWMEQRGGHW